MANPLAHSGHRDITLENKNIPYDTDTVIIQFDGLFSYGDKRAHLKIAGDHEWFSVKSLFNDE